jgi:hypothetical protein
VIHDIDEIYRNYLTGTWAKYQYTHLCAGVLVLPSDVRIQICRYLTDDLLFDQVLPFIVGTTTGKHTLAPEPILPYIYETKVSGHTFASEVAKTWYHHVHVVLHTIADPGPVLYKDPFCLGLEPWARFRRLTIHIDVNELAKSAGGSLAPDSVRAPFQNLYQIRLKDGFRLTVELHQQRINQDEMFAIYSVFQPIKEHFEENGAVVSLQMSPASGSIMLPLGPRSD